MMNERSNKLKSLVRMGNNLKEDAQNERRHHPAYVRKKRVRVKVAMKSGVKCIGDCHVVWPDGRTSDEINDDREFFLLTDATVEGEFNIYNILTLRKDQIEYMCEIHRENNDGNKVV